MTWSFTTLKTTIFGLGFLITGVNDMACDYHNRIDFRAFDVLADAIENATPQEIKHAIMSCDEIARNWNTGTNSHVAIKTLLFRGFANLMRLHLRKFNSKPRQAPDIALLPRGL